MMAKGGRRRRLDGPRGDRLSVTLQRRLHAAPSVETEK
jgi:hypothetical protein